MVVTVFAEMPTESGARTTYDVDCGWPNAAAAVTGRWAEDEKALNLLRATPVRLRFLDHQYREAGLTTPGSYPPATDAEIAGTIDVIGTSLALAIGKPPEMLAPLGLLHPDHHLTRRASELAARSLNAALWCYEDLPARVLAPEAVPDALAWWRGMGWEPTLDFIGTGPIEIKEAAVRCYRSQLWCPEFGGDALHTVLVPERIWKMTPC